ncbi:elongation factor-like GTPase 1 isoform X1 [Vanessa atalanta]|uniref:elongation factor-like GTPase 1 isoform X1 n=1 Tax=Vanessa atalanta TaxID=42275 RepID=UPI001FCE2EB8|nr:elongation factor-like GTPase 1 isoform X1 [Vanessa atalanta]
MRLVDSTKILELQNRPTKIRNICIVAHVDHGKTTLADSLISSNGIISQRMSGKLRYMDSRPDEQERGITMKSSSIALYHALDKEEYLVNLIDSPGHIDFSSEVSTAVRLCDGAIVVVDVVEGVCPQTRLALKQAYSESIQAVLVLNKIDRLIVEMKMSALDAYVHITQVLEQVNAVMGELFASEVLENEETLIDKQQTKKSVPKEDNNFYDWTSALEDADDSNLYFSPEQGNVVFASAIDGWGFTIHNFAKLFSDKLGVKEELLRKVLWGDFFLNSKTKRFMKGAQEKAKKPLFVQVIFDNLWNIYETIVLRNDKEKVPVICEKLGIKLTTRDLRHTDSRIQLQSLMTQWLPLSNTVLDMVCTKLPSPKEILPEKVEKLMCSRIRDLDTYPEETQKLKHDFLDCDSSNDRTVIIFVSKMFSVDKSVLPENKPKALTAEEMALRRERARQMRVELKQNNVNAEPIPISKDKELSHNDAEKCTEDEKEKEDENQTAFIAFARIFSGKVRKGDKLYVLGPKHDPSQVLIKKDIQIDPNKKLKDLQSDEHITCTEIKSLYILMGRELEDIDEAVAGNIIGIGGLQDHILKTATLSSTLACPAFSEIQYAAVPILRVAIEPSYPSQLSQLVKGLRLLNQSDSCVQVLLQETGEHVLVTAGEVHLQRCLEDLKNLYAKIPITVSEPIVPFRETIVEPPKIDMANEEIDSQNIDKGITEQDSLISISTINKQSTIKIRAKPLPNEITSLLDRSTDLLKAISQHIKILQGVSRNDNLESKFDELHINGKHQLSDRMLKLIEAFKSELQAICSKLGPEWKDIVNQIWSVGPRNCGPNLLLNQTPDYKTKFLHHEKELKEDPRFEYESSFVNGFQLASLAGPLCDEPMMGVAFCVEEWTMDKVDEDISYTYGPLSGQIMSAVKEGCKRAFQVQPQRLMAAMYSCDIVVDQKVLGKLYAALGRRGGRVIGSDLQSGSASFRVQALMPVAESFKFALELRTHTSGLAAPQLMFSHWEVIDIDPFWRPRTEEEYLHWGEKWDGVNRAKAYMDSVRTRKGLATDKQLVQHAEKQRTLSKKK